MTLFYMIYAPVLQNLRKKSKPGLAEGNFFTFPDLTAFLYWLGNGQKWSDLRDLKTNMPQMV